MKQEMIIELDAMQVSELVDVPAWIKAYCMDGASLVGTALHGCASGSYMPACEYYTASKTMFEHGDRVHDFIIDETGNSLCLELASTHSWQEFCVEVLSTAVKIWCGKALDELLELDDD